MTTKTESKTKRKLVKRNRKDQSNNDKTVSETPKSSELTDTTNDIVLSESTDNVLDTELIAKEKKKNKKLKKNIDTVSKTEPKEEAENEGDTKEETVSNFDKK